MAFVDPQQKRLYTVDTLFTIISWIVILIFGYFALKKLKTLYYSIPPVIQICSENESENSQESLNFVENDDENSEISKEPDHVVDPKWTYGDSLQSVKPPEAQIIDSISQDEPEFIESLLRKRARTH